MANSKTFMDWDIDYKNDSENVLEKYKIEQGIKTEDTFRLFPLTIGQIINHSVMEGEVANNIHSIHGHIVNQVELVGRVCNLSGKEPYYRMNIDDGTSIIGLFPAQDAKSVFRQDDKQYGFQFCNLFFILLDCFF